MSDFDYMPDVVFRSVLLHGLPDVEGGQLTDRTLFWVNVTAYRQHSDWKLPAEQVARHWKSIYDMYFAGEHEKLFAIPYLVFSDPYESQ